MWKGLIAYKICRIYNSHLEKVKCIILIAVEILNAIVQRTGSVHLTLIVGIKLLYTYARLPQRIENISILGLAHIILCREFPVV